MTHKHHPYIFVTGIFLLYMRLKNKDHERVPVWRTEGMYEVFGCM